MSTDEPASPTGHHLTLATLAELDEGLLAPPAEARVRWHLEKCAECLARLASVAGVRTALAAAPAEPLPTSVAGRLDAALARAAGDAAPARRPVRRSAGWQWRPGGGVLAGAAAASIVLLLFGALVLGALRDGADNASDSAAGKAKTTGPQVAAGAPATSRITASGRNYTPGTLPSAVPRLLAAPAADRQGPSAGSLAVGAGIDRLRDPRALASCVLELAGRPGVRALAVDLARYGGRAAAVVVLPENGAPALLDVWVVGPGCRTGDPQLLYFLRLTAAGMSAP